MREGFVILEINNTPMKSVSDLESMYDSIVKSNQNQKLCSLRVFIRMENDVLCSRFGRLNLLEYDP